MDDGLVLLQLLSVVLDMDVLILVVVDDGLVQYNGKLYEVIESES